MLHNKFKVMLAIIIAIGFLSLVWYLITADSPTTSISEVTPEVNLDLTSIPEVVASESSILDKIQANNKDLIELLNDKSITIAILGTDERASETSRSDIVMVVKYYPKLDKAILVSIPRDTRVEIPDVKTDKINHAFAFGGPELSQKTLENLLDISIDYYIKFSFEDFVKIVDDLGGVNINAAKDFGYNGNVQVSKGEHLLKGEDALFYVRFRQDSDGDFGRIKRQQEVVKSLSDAIKTSDIKNSVKILNQTYSYLVTNMTSSDMANYLALVKDKDDIQIIDRTLKTTGIMIDRIYYGKYDEDDLAEIKELLN